MIKCDSNSQPRRQMILQSPHFSFNVMRKTIWGKFPALKKRKHSALTIGQHVKHWKSGGNELPSLLPCLSCHRCCHVWMVSQITLSFRSLIRHWKQHKPVYSNHIISLCLSCKNNALPICLSKIIKVDTYLFIFRLHSLYILSLISFITLF